MDSSNRPLASKGIYTLVLQAVGRTGGGGGGGGGEEQGYMFRCTLCLGLSIVYCPMSTTYIYDQSVFMKLRICGSNYVS